MDLVARGAVLLGRGKGVRGGLGARYKRYEIFQLRACSVKGTYRSVSAFDSSLHVSQFGPRCGRGR